MDYLQIVDSKEGDPRSKVADVVAQIDELLRAYRCVGILISQMSRNASRESKNGDRFGADTTDGGAESAAIERAAVYGSGQVAAELAKWTGAAHGGR
jgi:hypothetical protein